MINRLLTMHHFKQKRLGRSVTTHLNTTFKGLALMGLVIALALMLSPTPTQAAAKEARGDMHKIVDSPVRGMSKEEVVDRHGQPLKELPATGKPPIERWIYPAFTVYFEYNSVLHSVVARRSQNTADNISTEEPADPAQTYTREKDSEEKDSE